MATENEEFEFRARAEREGKQSQGGGKPPLGFVAKQMWGIMPQNPKNLVKNLPLATGAIGGASPIPGGAMMGTGLGQMARAGINRMTGQPQQRLGQIGGELGGAALGDILAIPALKRAHYGGQIGKAEKAAGLVTRASPKAVTPGSVGETLNNLEAQIDAGTINTPQAARDAKAVMKQIFKNPKIYEQTDEISVQSARVGKKVSDLLNKMVPGRLAPSQAMAKAMTIPNVIKRGYQATPWQVKLGVLGGGTEAVIRKLLGL